MSNVVYKLKMAATDTEPGARFNVNYRNDDGSLGDPVDFTAGATARLVIRNNQTGQVTNATHEACPYTGAQINQVQYSFQVGDIPVAGVYLCDLIITNALGREQTLYDYVQINVRARQS